MFREGIGEAISCPRAAPILGVAPMLHGVVADKQDSQCQFYTHRDSDLEAILIS